MSDVSVFAAFAAGSFMGALAMAVFMSLIVHRHYENYLAMKATAFGLDQQVTHLMEGREPPHWQTRQGGVDDMVTRGRPDVYQRDSIIDLTETGDTPE